MSLLWRAGWVLPVAGAPIRDGAVVVRDGRIAWVGSATDATLADHEVRELGAGVLLPGLINAHCHVELSHLAGAVPAAAGFSAWVEELVRQRAGETREQVRSAAEKALHTMAELGTVAVGDISNRLEHLDLFAGAGLRAVVFHELLGWDPARAEHVLAVADGLRAGLAVPTGVRVALAAHAPHSVSAPLFAALVARGGPASLHLAESPDEVRFLQSGDGPWRAFLEQRMGPVDCAPPGASPVRYVDGLGVLQPNLLAVHCVQTNAADAQLLAERGVSVALCPRSNSYLGVGRAPLPLLLEAGVHVCLGTDSLASAPSLDVLDDLRALHAEHAGIAPFRLLEMATRNGARALGFADLGTLEPGQAAALAYLPAERTLKDPLAYLLHGQARASRVA